MHPDGTSQLVTCGLLNLRHRESREHPSALEPGQPYDVELELEVTSWVFEEGHRIRLDLAGADWPNVWAPPYAGTLTVEREGSALVLPTVEGPPAIQERPSLPPPAASRNTTRRPGARRARPWSVGSSTTSSLARREP